MSVREGSSSAAFDGNRGSSNLSLFAQCRRDDVQIVPILVGAISANTEAHFGQLLASYLADPSTFFVVSSDFCHW